MYLDDQQWRLPVNVFVRRENSDTLIWVKTDWEGKQPIQYIQMLVLDLLLTLTTLPNKVFEKPWELTIFEPKKMNPVYKGKQN